MVGASEAHLSVGDKLVRERGRDVGDLYVGQVLG